MAQVISDIRNRVTSICVASPFAFSEAVDPFDFEKQPTGKIDRVFRITTEEGSVIGGLNFTEDRTDPITIWVARKQAAAPATVYRQLLNDASSLRAAVIRDGAGAGDYAVPDAGAGISINRDPGKEYAVLRLTVPVNYEATV